MFKDSAKARYVLRGVVVGLIAFFATLRASIGGGLDPQEWVDLASNTLGAVAAYFGIGAAFGSVEPFVGNKMEGAAVPVPPADPEPADKPAGT